MAKANIRTFTSDTGAKPVETWIRSLAPAERAEIILTIELLEEHGAELKAPHVRHLESGIRELRERVRRAHLRVLYFHWKGMTFGLLHGFVKRSRATPRSELELALERRTAWLARSRHEREDRDD